MKIKSFALLFLGMSFFACSDNDEVANQPVTEKLVFEISANDQLQNTRAGDPVYSQNIALKVTQVTIHAFQKTGADYLFQKTYTIPNWTAGATRMTYEVLENERLPIGEYKFLAIGRDATDHYQITNLEVGTTKAEDIAAAITASGDEYEIFAGMVDKTINDTGTRVNITMTRKVAGVLGYFKNIPQEMNGRTVKYLQLAINKNNMSVNLSTGAGIVPTGNGYNIFKMDLSGQTVTNEGLYSGNDLSGAGIVKLDNSQLNGSYIIPVAGASITLALLDENDNIIKSWSIVTSTNMTTFDINANQFYSLGRKVVANVTTGDPTDPNDDDDAINLLVDEEIAITIDPTWSVINYLNIQDSQI